MKEWMLQDFWDRIEPLLMKHALIYREYLGVPVC
jgi:hypothetical protein